MTITNTDIELEIRTFLSAQEIWGLSVFKHDNPVNEGNYERLIGDYDFDDEVRCCFQQKSGELCREGHKWGYVAKLKDGSVTIVGNECARKNFPDTANIRHDINRYRNEKKRRERLASLRELIATKQDRLNKLDSLRTSLVQLQSRARNFESLLGKITLRRLQDMGRTGNSSVRIEGIFYREYTDDKGKKKYERRSVPDKLGSLQGLAVFSSVKFDAVYAAIRTVRLAYEDTNEISENMSATDLASLTSNLGKYDIAIREGEALLRDEKLFLGSDLTLLCYLVEDKSERYKAARFALEQSGRQKGKDQAKVWLSEKDTDIKKRLGVDKIKMPH